MFFSFNDFQYFKRSNVRFHLFTIIYEGGGSKYLQKLFSESETVRKYHSSGA